MEMKSSSVILKGAARTIDLFGLGYRDNAFRRKKLTISNFQKNDGKAIASDWKAIGYDIMYGLEKEKARYYE